MIPQLGDKVLTKTDYSRNLKRVGIVVTVCDEPIHDQKPFEVEYKTRWWRSVRVWHDYYDLKAIVKKEKTNK